MEGIRLAGPRIKDVETAIKQIASVISCRVFAEAETGEIEEIHILADTSRHAKQVVRDVETICRACLGIRIDYRRISVVQLADAADLIPETVDARVSLESVRLSLSGNTEDVEVGLRWGNEFQAGSASGVKRRRGGLELVATATLNAVKGFSYSKGMDMVLEDIVTQRICGQIAVVALIVLVDGGRERMCLGSSFVKTHEVEAGARCILDALNRHLAWRGATKHEYP